MANWPEWQGACRLGWEFEHGRNKNDLGAYGHREFDPSQLYVIFVVNFFTDQRLNPTPVSKCGCA